ncbi:CoA-binding protein [Reyranella aquatilis]|uniref:CoA-binding protein n=1 Tax=Reyranella aquatilis TaxID=2035356 RepID=A0ABS8KMR1_9HYPH|nr:CoA-binding protein [Reyranella aquatilis]MCC8427335.1 CoA-binding protein [Reyranella aquatilis]
MTSPDLTRLFSPRSIAVLGASASSDKLGGQVFARLAASFRGELIAINPGESDIAGRRSMSSVEALPQPVDLLIALAPGERLVEAIERCPAGLVGFLLAIPSGFGEVAHDGPDLQQRLAAAARRAGLRVVGPNCVGLLNASIGLNASIIPLMPPGGSAGLGVATQSGGFGMALAMYAADSGMAVSCFCDVGNTVDISLADCLAHLAGDPATGVIGLYVESVRDLPSFTRALSAATAAKPVVVCPLARTPSGQAASLAHVGIPADGARLSNDLPAGAIVVHSGLDLLHAARALLWQGRPLRGRRLAIVTGTGGIGTEIADLAEEQGMVVPRFSARLTAAISRHLPAYAASANPVDLTPVWRDYPRLYPLVMAEIAASGEADLIAVSITDVPTTWPDLAESLARSVPALGLPVAVYWASRDADVANMAPLHAARIPTYRATRELALALGAIARHGTAGGGDAA